jgi:hypothetical protein
MGSERLIGFQHDFIAQADHLSSLSPLVVAARKARADERKKKHAQQNS